MASDRRSLRVVPESGTFASLLASKRRGSGQTQAQVAKSIGVRQQTIAAWESGDRPQPRFLPALVEYLELGSEAALRQLLELTPPTTADVAAPQPHKSAQVLYDTLAESFALRSRVGPMSVDETALFKELLTHYGQDLARGGDNRTDD